PGIWCTGNNGINRIDIVFLWSYYCGTRWNGSDCFAYPGNWSHSFGVFCFRWHSRFARRRSNHRFIIYVGIRSGTNVVQYKYFFIVAIIAAVILYKWVGMERGFFRRMILRDSTSTELGYVSSVNRLELVGLEGTTATAL